MRLSDELTRLKGLMLQLREEGESLRREAENARDAVLRQKHSHAARLKRLEEKCVLYIHLLTISGGCSERLRFFPFIIFSFSFVFCELFNVFFFVFSNFL